MLRFNDIKAEYILAYNFYILLQYIITKIVKSINHIFLDRKFVVISNKDYWKSEDFNPTRIIMKYLSGPELDDW